MNLNELKTALEAATGPDTTLDLELFRHFNPNRNHYTWLHGRPCLYSLFEGGYRAVEPSTYTSSLDIAITLVPKGCIWLRKSLQAMTIVPVPDNDKEWAKHYEAAGATPAIALCLARVNYELENAS